MRAVAVAVWAALRRRRLPSLVIGFVVLLCTATAVLAAGLLMISRSPFAQSFDRQIGAQATAGFDPDLAGADQVAATAEAPGVRATAGPFDTVNARVIAGSMPMAVSASVVGRAEQNGPVDRLAMDSGRWLSGPGQIVLSRGLAGPRGTEPGARVTLDLPGAPTLEVVGVATSITGTGDAWVWPTQSDVLHAAGATTLRQMLYRFADADDEESVRTSLSAATAGLPAKALIGSSSYLDAQFASNRAAVPVVPFVIAFALLGLAMSVLIVANVVSGAVVAGYRRIGVLKALGFTPRQVVGAYSGQALVPGIVGCLVGVPLGNLLASPVLRQTNRAYGVTAGPSLPWWVDGAAALVVTAAVGVAVIVTTRRAGRLPAVAAIANGRTPRDGRGFRIRRLLATTRLPRPVSFGLATPFARPARSAATLFAVLLGAVSVVFAIGLAGSLTQVLNAFARTSAVPVDVSLPLGAATDGGAPRGGGAPRSDDAAPNNSAPNNADAAAIRAIIESQPGTAHVAGARLGTVTVTELNEPITVVGYDTDVSWAGYALASGRWYAGPDEVLADSYLLHSTGTAVGDTLTLRTGQGQRRVQVVGEVLDQTNHGLAVIGQNGVFSGLSGSTAPNRFEIGLAAGVDAERYVRTLSLALGDQAHARVRAMQGLQRELGMMIGLLVVLTLLLSGVAALGVFNTVVLNTRERVHEIAVLKSIGMTPRQVRTMVVVSVAGIGLLAGAIAVPLGYALHRIVVPMMADAAQIDTPTAFLDTYQPLELLGLGLAGAVLAVLGALVPAGWAARARTAVALRAE